MYFLQISEAEINNRKSWLFKLILS